MKKLFIVLLAISAIFAQSEDYFSQKNGLYDYTIYEKATFEPVLRNILTSPIQKNAFTNCEGLTCDYEVTITFLKEQTLSKEFINGEIAIGNKNMAHVEGIFYYDYREIERAIPIYEDIREVIPCQDDLKNGSVCEPQTYTYTHKIGEKIERTTEKYENYNIEGLRVKAGESKTFVIRFRRDNLQQFFDIYHEIKLSDNTLPFKSAGWWNTTWAYKFPFNITTTQTINEAQVFISADITTSGNLNGSDMRITCDYAGTEYEVPFWRKERAFGKYVTGAFESGKGDIAIKANFTAGTPRECFIYVNATGVTVSDKTNASAVFVMSDLYDHDTSGDYSCVGASGVTYNTTAQAIQIQHTGFFSCGIKVQNITLSEYVVEVDLEFLNKRSDNREQYNGGVCGFQTIVADTATGYCTYARNYENLLSILKVGVDYYGSVAVILENATPYTTKLYVGAGNQKANITISTNNSMINTTYQDGLYSGKNTSLVGGDSAVLFDNFRVYKYINSSIVTFAGMESQASSPSNITINNSSTFSCFVYLTPNPVNASGAVVASVYPLNNSSYHYLYWFKDYYGNNLTNITANSSYTVNSSYNYTRIYIDVYTNITYGYDYCGHNYTLVFSTTQINVGNNLIENTITDFITNYGDIIMALITVGVAYAFSVSLGMGALLLSVLWFMLFVLGFSSLFIYGAAVMLVVGLVLHYANT